MVIKIESIYDIIKKVKQESSSLDNSCHNGHDWSFQGGRSCPKELHDCSQSVYVCKICQEIDYGYKNGPSHDECFIKCSRFLNEED